MKILVIHGPNLNLLGERPSKHYGDLTLTQVNQKMRSLAKQLKMQIKIVQTNHEGKIVDLLHANRKWADAVIINPAAYTHTSIAIRDAIEAIQTPVVEVHLSDIYTRESFRKVSLIKDVCAASFIGHKANSYLRALEFLQKDFQNGR